MQGDGRASLSWGKDRLQRPKDSLEGKKGKALSERTLEIEKRSQAYVSSKNIGSGLRSESRSARQQS